MATKVRIRRKDLRRPDEFITATQRAMAIVQEHSQLFAWVAGGVAVGFIALVIMINVRAGQAEKASAALGSAIGAYAAGNYEQAATLLDAFQNDWPTSSLRPLASLYRGETALERGNYAQAVLGLEDALDGLQSTYLRQQALVSLGYALEGSENYAQASQRFAQAAGLSGPFKPIALLGQARTSEKNSDPAGARAIYEKFLTEFPTSTERGFVESRLAQLSSS